MLLTCMKEEEEECDVVIGRSMRAENDVFLRSVSKQDTKHFLGEQFFRHLSAEKNWSWHAVLECVAGDDVDVDGVTTDLKQ